MVDWLWNSGVAILRTIDGWGRFFTDEPTFSAIVREHAGSFLIGFIPSTFLLLVVLWKLRRHRSHSVTISIPFGLGSWSYDTSPVDRIVAWKMHVQLVTRKAALPFNAEHDLVCDVYDSLFTLFGETRSLLLELPPREFERSSGVGTLILRVQNDGIRPHLTRWQAHFRRWWEQAENDPKNCDRSPQDIQRDFPRYEELVVDLKNTNTELRKFADELLRIANPPKRRRRDRVIAWLPWKSRGTKPLKPSEELPPVPINHEPPPSTAYEGSNSA